MDSDQAESTERRKGNHDLESVIDRAIVMLQNSGEGDARRHLVAHGVPEHITLRVMACAAFRRQCRPATSSAPRGGGGASQQHSLAPPASPAAMPRHLRRGNF